MTLRWTVAPDNDLEESSGSSILDFDIQAGKERKRLLMGSSPYWTDDWR